MSADYKAPFETQQPIIQLSNYMLVETPMSIARNHTWASNLCNSRQNTCPVPRFDTFQTNNKNKHTGSVIVVMTAGIEYDSELTF